jgi:hypothetical protein
MKPTTTNMDAWGWVQKKTEMHFKQICYAGMSRIQLPQCKVQSRLHDNEASGSTNSGRFLTS